MSMYHAERTGKIKFTSGLVDYETEGIFHTGLHKIPCTIGYVDSRDNFTGKAYLEPVYLFIKDGVTENGIHYEKTTIDLTIRKDIAVKEEY